MSLVKYGRKDARTCYKCGKTGHINAACPEKRGRSATQNTELVLTVKNSTVDWFLDSGSSEHLVNDSSLLEDPEEHASE